MAQWTDYFRIVQPQSTNTNYEVSDVTSMDNFSWYKNVMYGSANRSQGYSNFEVMDNDQDVSRSLDIISEEIATLDEKTQLPFSIVYHNDDNVEVEESVVMTLKASLRQWNRLHRLDQNVFSIARNTIKYGDCFLRKVSDYKKWKFVHPRDIYGIEIDENFEIVFYLIKRLASEKWNLSGSKSQSYEIEKVPASGIVHFSMCDDMNQHAPFGQSVLNAALKVYKQKSLIEDAIIIYRVVRAPERRIFYVDTGNLPAQKSKALLEQVKFEVRQKRVPNMQGGSPASTEPDIDSVYNPLGTIEDYFFGVTSTGRGSRVETLPGGQNLGELQDLEYFKKGLLVALRVPTSYMNGSDAAGAQYNDGKVGVAYIEELRFANMIKRYQAYFENVFDAQFKIYLKSSGINIDPTLFSLKLPDPQNFALYRQSALNSDLIATFSQADGIKYLSKRFILKRYLGFTEDDVQTNEALLRQEQNVPDPTDPNSFEDIQKFYGEASVSDPGSSEQSLSDSSGLPDLGSEMDLTSSDPSLDESEPEDSSSGDLMSSDFNSGKSILNKYMNK